ARIGYTLKHYPGLGSDPADASHSTDTEPNTVTEPAAEIHADDAAYRECGNGAVMLSSASYPALSGRAPAVLSRSIYAKTLRGDHVHGLLISDTFTGGAIKNQRTPAKTAISLGLDMVMYPDTMSSGLGAYGSLLADVKSGSLGAARVQAAAAKVLAYKKALGLGS
ncbi:MAG: hypothetical protein J2O48_13110, partial [Solirubrobacterales bacterium]|nr:hypothetical protein [Solirubrobacterales bacterium]